MAAPITSSLLLSSSRAGIDVSSRALVDHAVCQGNISPREAKGLWELFNTQFLCGKRSYTLRSLFIALDEAKCLGSGSVTLVGSYVLKALGTPFFRDHAKTDVGASFEITPHDIDFRIALSQTIDFSARETLKKKIEQTLKRFFGSDLVLEPFQNIEDPAEKNHFVIAGMEGSIRIEMLWVTGLGRRSLFNEDGLHLEIPRAFWLHESGFIRWNSGEMPLTNLIENCVKDELSVTHPETVDKRGWGRLMVKLAAGKSLQDESIGVTFLLKALLNVQKNKGEGLARLLTHATRHLPEEQNIKVFAIALDNLKQYLGSPNLIHYTLEDLKTFIRSYFPDTLNQSVWLYLLCRDKTIAFTLKELSQNDSLKTLIMEKAPEVSRLLEAKEGASQLAALVEFCAFEAAWKAYQANSFRIPLSKFLLGIIRASLKYPQHLTEGVHFLAQESFSKADRSEALRHLFLYLPSTPFPIPRILFIEAEAALTEEELMALYSSWVYPILVQEVAKYSSLEEGRLHFHLVGPEGERFVPAALKTFKEEVPLEDPLSYAKKHESTLYSVQFLIYFKQLKSTHTAAFYLSVFIRHYEALRKERALLEQAQKRLLDLIPYLSCEPIVEKWHLIEEEKIAILIQEAPRLKDNVNAQQEVNRILDKPPDPETPAKKIVQLIQLFCSGYPLSMEIWLRWLTAVQQKHFEGKRGRVLEALRDIPKGNPDQTERFWINLFRILQKLPENPLRPLIRSEDLDAVIAARAPLFLEALEGFLLKHFKKREEAAYFRPYLEVLHKRGRLDDPKWIPSFSRMEESDLTLWSANFTSEVVILALFKEKVDRKGDQETVFTLYNKLKGKEQEEAAHFLGSADPSLFTEAIVNGYIDPYLQVPSFYPLFEQAAKGHFFQLYEYPGLKDFFSHHISLTCKEKGFYDLIVHKKTAFISGKECLESEISPITQTNLLRFIADLERCSEEFKRRLLDWSVDPDNTIEFTESLSIRLQIALRFLCFGDTSAQKGSDLEKSCNFLFHIFNNFFAPDLIDKFFLGLLLRSMGIPGSSEHEYLVSMLRDQSMQKATDYRSLDPLLKENQEKESIAMGVFLKRMEPSKREGFASKLLFAMNLMVGQLNSESPMFYNYLDFVATQFYWIVFEWDIFPPSQKLNALECFHQFCLWPGFNRAVSDEHMMRCRQLFLLFDQREGFNPSHLRKYQGDEIARFFYLQGFLSIILGLQIKVNFNKQATLLQTVYFEIFESCQQFLRKRDEEGIEKKSVILSRLMILLMPHPLHVFPEPYKSLRRDSVNQLVEFMKRFPEALVDDYFQCKLLFTALIPHAPNGLAEYKFETKFIKNFPRWLIGNLQGCSDQSKVPPHLLDELFLTFITYFFLISKPPVILDDERYWFKKRAISLFDSVVKAFKSEETYQSQFSGYAFLAAQLIAPTKKRHQLIKEIMGEAGLHFACAISNAIVCASWREDEKRKVLEVFLGTLGISGYLDNGRLLTALSPEGARLAGFNRHNLPFETVFNRKWFGLFDG